MIEIKCKAELESQLKQVVKMYDKGIITYAEYIFKQADLIQSALVTGVPWAEINCIEI